MADEVKIDKTLFHERLSQFISALKADKRAGNDAIFGGVGSIVILLGKADDAAYQKNNAMHVSWPPLQHFRVGEADWDASSSGCSATNSQQHFSFSHKTRFTS